MLKTNSKQARENIRAHVIECALEYISERDDVSTEKPVTSAWAIIRREKSHMIERKCSNHEILADHVMGLGYGDLMNATDVLKSALDETEEEAARFSISESENLYINLLSRHFFEILEKESAR